MDQDRYCKICQVTPPKTYVTRGQYTCKPCKYSFVAPSCHIQHHVANVRGGGPYATDHTIEMGTQAERCFVRYCKLHKLRVRPATKYENMILHYDYVVETRNKSYPRVEVKSIKSRRRGLPPDPRVIFVELKDIDGNPGWLYGKADVIAFQQPEPVGFIFVHRKDLLDIVDVIKKECRMSLQSGVHHTLYSRPNRHDLMLVLDIDDIQPIALPKRYFG